MRVNHAGIPECRQSKEKSASRGTWFVRTRPTIFGSYPSLRRRRLRPEAPRPTVAGRTSGCSRRSVAARGRARGWGSHGVVCYGSCARGRARRREALQGLGPNPRRGPAPGACAARRRLRRFGPRIGVRGLAQRADTRMGQALTPQNRGLGDARGPGPRRHRSARLAAEALGLEPRDLAALGARSQDGGHHGGMTPPPHARAYRRRAGLTRGAVGARGTDG
jgi:hypothetical protein